MFPRIAGGILIYFFLSLQGLAQLYPILSQLSVPAPVPYSLEGFSADGGSRMSLRILINDLTLVDYPVKLRLLLQGPGVRIETGSWVAPQALLLTAGEPQFFDGIALASLFKPDNLQFSGMSRSAYEKSRQLPEGMYQASIEVLDYYRGIRVSSSPPALLFVSLCDPPLLNLPLEATEASLQENSFLLFSWTSRHTSFVYPGFQPLYQLEFWEIWPDDRQVQELVNSMPPAYSEATSQTSLQLSLDEFNLLPGRRYAWRVRITDPDGLAAFRDMGCSQIRAFRYGKYCPPADPKLISISSGSASLSCGISGAQEAIEFQYSSSTASRQQWYNQRTLEPQIRLGPLKAGTGYEVQARASCKESVSEWCDPLLIRTPDRPKPICGGSMEHLQISNKKPLPRLYPGEFIQAADFQVEVLEASGTDGRFSGRGLLLVPWFNMIKLEVVFEQIGINEEYQLLSGSIRSVYNLSNALVQHVPDFSGLFSGDADQLEDPFEDLAKQVIHTDSSIREVVLEEDGSIVLVTKDGASITLTDTSGRLIEIVGAAGENFLVDRETKTVYMGSSTAPSSPVKELNEGEKSAYSVFFTPEEKTGPAGYDLPQEDDPAENYRQVLLDGKMEKLAWISLQKGSMAGIRAMIQGSPADSVKFLCTPDKMVMASASPNPAEKKLLLAAQAAGEEESLQAYYTRKAAADSEARVENLLAGELKLVTYEQQELRLALVAVNGSDCPKPDEMRDYLNKVYAPALTRFEVIRVDSFFVSLSDQSGKKLDNTDKDQRMNYSSEMQQVIDAFRESSTFDGEYVLFFFDGSKDAETEGYMPFKKRYGFVFRNAQSELRWCRTIAHELGHGAFRLRHTYSEENEFFQAEGSTGNLMDKGSGGRGSPPSLKATAGDIRLYKYQWDQVQDPEARFNWWEEEEEGEMDYRICNLIRAANLKGENTLDLFISNDYAKILESFKLDKVSYKFISITVQRDPNTASSYDLNINPSLGDPQNINHFQIDPRDTSSFLRDSLRETFSVGFNEILNYKNNLPEKSENTLIRIECPLINSSNLIEYLFPKAEFNIGNISWFSQVDSRFKDESCYCGKQNKDGKCKNLCCERTCREVLFSVGLTATRTNAIDITKLIDENDYNELYATNNFEEGYTFIDSCIEKASIPVIVGVNHEASYASGNYNSATFHFVVIVGKGFDRSKSQFYYRFYEVGTQYQNKGSSENNRLYIDLVNKVISGPAPIRNWNYTITEVRRTKRK